MSIQSLLGRHFRLQQGLAVASGAVPWNTGRIDRLTAELASTELRIMGASPSPQVTDEAPGHSAVLPVPRSALVSLPASV
jgi:hypothetical protein